VEAIMPGGRPEAGKQRVHPELTELAAWFQRALIEAGYDSVNALVQRHPFEKNRIYGLFKGTRFLPLEATQAVAVALGRKSEEIVPLWWRAKAAMDRAAAAEREAGSRIESWSQLPWPHVALQDILEAQSHAADMLPYHLLDIQPPPLSAVYVRQQAKPDQTAAKRDREDPRGVPTDEPSRASDDAAISITAALNRHEHLIITGEPGAGKSTLAQFLALALSRLWLRTSTGDDPVLSEPVVPLRVAARGLASDETWSAALARATRQVLGRRLVAEPSASLFERRLQGARWLVLVDGLDEIVDPGARFSVVQALAARCRAGGDYRLVITTRQLSDVEFAPLRGQHVATYALEPFGRLELDAFAQSWFTAQHTTDPDGDAAQFVRQIDDGGLRELARNPLLATIAAIAYTIEPTRPLPNDRLGLYERFFEHLVLRDSGGRDTIAELRRLFAGEPDRLAFISWLFQERVQLLRHLALARLDSERPLRSAAHDWVRDHANELAPGWEDDIEAVLASTGVLVFNSDGVRFLHHSFAEFFAAQEHASRIGADFPELDAWINRAMRPAEREFAMFVFAMWSIRPGHQLGRIFEVLLGGHPDHLLLAGRVLARAPRVTMEDNERVVDRLVDLAVGAAMVNGIGRMHDIMGYAALSTTPMSAMVEVLGQLTHNPYAATRLRGIADVSGAPLVLRIAALAALGKIDDTSDAANRLRQLIPHCRNTDLVEAARTLNALAPDDQLSLSSLIRVGDDPSASAQARADAAAELSTVGQTAEATRIAHAIMMLRPTNPEALRRATSTWLECVTDLDERSKVIEQLIRQPLHPELCQELAAALSEAGLRDQAGQLALHILSNPASAPWLLSWAVKQSADSAGMLPAGLRAALPNSTGPDGLASAAQGFAEAAHVEIAVELAQAVIPHPSADAYDIARATKAWLTATGATSMPDIREALDRRFASHPVEWAGVIAQQLSDEGQKDAAIHYARLVFQTQRTYAGSLRNAAQAWLSAAGPNAAAEIRAVVHDDPPLTPGLLAMTAEGLALGGSAALAADLALEAFADIGLDNYRVGNAIRAVVIALGPAADQPLRAMMATRPFDSLEWLAITEHLLASGALEAAQRIWIELIVRHEARFEHRILAAARLVASGGADAAREAIDAEPSDQRTVIALLTALSTLA
jgi:hypothetical protein